MKILCGLDFNRDICGMETIYPFSKPLYVMAKPAGPACNLACEYCYYLEKLHLYRKEQPVPKFEMSDEILEMYIRQYLESQTMPQVLFTWHGGEALMRPLSFYRKVVGLQKKYARGRQVDNSIQTNATLLTDEWCQFFRDNHWLVGVSIDGPEKFHDRYRHNLRGKPSFAKVMKGIELLNRYGVEWNALAVVNDYNGNHPLEFYRFFKDIQCRYIQFTPIVERITTHSDGRHLACPADSDDLPLAPFSVQPGQWGEFLCAIFDEWVYNDVGRYFIQLFDSTLANWLGEQPGICTLARTCGHAGVMEYNGDVFACDHFVFPEYKLGNIREQSLVEMMYGEKEQNFGAAKYNSLPRQCRECKYLFACNGECPKNRFLHTSDGEPGLNWLCEGYYRFFEHVAPAMDFMKRELLARRSPANIMAALRR